MPKAPAPNGSEGRYSSGRDEDRGEALARHEVRADQRVLPAERVDEGDRDDRQGQDVGQQPLVEVRGEPDDEGHEPAPRRRPSRADPTRTRPAAAPRATAPTMATVAGPPVDRPTGRMLLIVLRPAGREPVRGRARSGTRPGARMTASGDRPRRDRVRSARRGRRRAPAPRAWRALTPVAPRGAHGSGLAEVGRPRDVEVRPRLGHELARGTCRS